MVIWEGRGKNYWGRISKTTMKIDSQCMRSNLEFSDFSKVNYLFRLNRFIVTKN